MGHVHAAIGSHGYDITSSVERLVAWAPPLVGLVALNVNESVVTISRFAGFGDLIRDHNEMFLHGFYGHGIITWITFMEIFTLYQGLLLGFMSIMCYSYSLFGNFL